MSDEGLDFNTPMKGVDFFGVLEREGCILSSNSRNACSVLAVNIRNLNTIPGALKAAIKEKAVLILEFAPIEMAWTGITPEEVYSEIQKNAKLENYKLPFILHADHITVSGKNPAEIKESAENSRKLIRQFLSAGFTSFAIDASYEHQEYCVV